MTFVSGTGIPNNPPNLPMHAYKANNMGGSTETVN